jgi:hypothetical protein
MGDYIDDQSVVIIPLTSCGPLRIRTVSRLINKTADYNPHSARRNESRRSALRTVSATYAIPPSGDLDACSAIFKVARNGAIMSG